MSRLPPRPKRKATVISVPAPNQDAAERKRVLNVLAQRRYRERKREHLKSLESQVESVSSSPSLRGSETTSPEDALTRTPQRQNTTNSSPPVCEPSNLGHHFNASSVEGVYDAHSTSSRWSPGSFELSLEPWLGITLLPSLPGSPVCTPSTITSSSEEGAYAETSPSSLDSVDWPMTAGLDLSSALQTTSTTSYTFPDERHTNILELKLLRGCMMIAQRLNIEDLLWSLDSISPFTDPSLAGLAFDHLPVNLRPTKTQQLIPHHPMLDIIAWPAMRDKLILVFSQDPAVRPPIAASPTSMMDLVYDVEDSAEGVRIWGEDPCDSENWECGEALFRKWWWSLDSNIIRKSNHWRRERGAPMLGGFVVEEA